MEKEKTYYINIIEGDLVTTKDATQAEIDKLRAEGKDVVVAELADTAE